MLQKSLHRWSINLFFPFSLTSGQDQGGRPGGFRDRHQSGSPGQEEKEEAVRPLLSESDLKISKIRRKNRTTQKKSFRERFNLTFLSSKKKTQPQQSQHETSKANYLVTLRSNFCQPRIWNFGLPIFVSIFFPTIDDYFSSWPFMRMKAKRN